MLSCQVESLTEKLSEIKPLLPDHWRELALDQEKVPLDPMYERYLDLERQGSLLFVTIRENGHLMGYFLGLIAPSLHYRECLTLTMDIFWLHPDIRDGDSLTAIDAEMISMELFETVGKESKRRGVKRAIYGSKLHKDTAALFQALGAIEIERYWSLWLGD